MNTKPAITGRDLHRIEWGLCPSCDTCATCLEQGCVGIEGDKLPEPDDRPVMPTPEQAMGAAYAVPTWALVALIALLCFVYIVTRLPQ